MYAKDEVWRSEERLHKLYCQFIRKITGRMRIDTRLPDSLFMRPELRERVEATPSWIHAVAAEIKKALKDVKLTKE